MEHELPKSFQHAIHISRTLGVRYLWIDAVCIIQKNEKDWLQESEKMGSIFANALLTLVAAGGEHSEDGMFNKRSTYGANPGNQWITLHTTSTGSAFGSTLYLSTSSTGDLNFRPHRVRGSLLSRAWCLQEDLLSTRKLYYASDQLYWECDQLAISEDGLADPTYSSLPQFECLNNLEESALADHASSVWYEYVIGQAYSKRVATNATDRLIAVAGLARHAANTIKSPYLAGLWESSVLNGLLWQTWLWGKEGVETHCAPSWSWASQEFHTEWACLGRRPENMIMVSGCEYLRAHIDRRSSDLYGGVISGTLTLRSKIVEVLLEEVTDGIQRRVSASYEGIRGWAVLDRKMSFSKARVLAIPILYDASLLVMEGSKSDVYRRVGIWRIPYQMRTRRKNYWPLETWHCPAEYLRWKTLILPRIPVMEITIE